MQRRLGEQPIPPPRPVWEWWRFPACWAVLAVLVWSVASAITRSPWWWVPAGAIILAIALAWAVQDRDCR